MFSMSKVREFSDTGVNTPGTATPRKARTKKRERPVTKALSNMTNQDLAGPEEQRRKKWCATYDHGFTQNPKSPVHQFSFLRQRSDYSVTDLLLVLHGYNPRVRAQLEVLNQDCTLDKAQLARSIEAVKDWYQNHYTPEALATYIIGQLYKKGIEIPAMNHDDLIQYLERNFFDVQPQQIPCPEKDELSHLSSLLCTEKLSM